MALTPEDVINKRFTTVRLREGYDMTEVDQFLDEVEAELRRFGSENSELQARNGAAVPVGATAPAATTPTAPTAPAAPEARPESEREERQAPPEPAVTTVPEQTSIKVTTTAEASAAATRLLELAGRNADELVLEAR